MNFGVCVLVREKKKRIERRGRGGRKGVGRRRIDVRRKEGETEVS